MKALCMTSSDNKIDVPSNLLVKQSDTDLNIVLASKSYSLTIDKIDTSSKNWKIIQTDEYRPDKQAYVEAKFYEDFAELGQQSFDQIASLASRSSLLNKWLVSVNASFAIDVAPPFWLQEEIPSEEYVKIQPIISKLSQAAADRASKESAAAKEYRAKLDGIEKDFNTKMNEFKSDNNIIKILTIQSTKLPLSFQLAIDNYTPLAAQAAPNQRMFAREVLTSYKISLLKFSKDNPQVDIQKVIDEMATK